MSQRIKTREELLSEFYLKRIEVKRLFKLNDFQTNKTYHKAQDIDSLDEFCLETNKVKKSTVMKLLKISERELRESALNEKKALSENE